MKKIKCVLSLLLLVLPSTASADLLTTEQPAKPLHLSLKKRLSLFESGYSLSYTVSSIPAPIKQWFHTHYGERAFQMVEPEQKFKETDDGQNSGLPSRRLVFVGRTRDHCIVCYEQGGFASNEIAASFRLIHNRAHLMWAADCGKKVGSVAELRKVYLAKKLYP